MSLCSKLLHNFPGAASQSCPTVSKPVRNATGTPLAQPKGAGRAQPARKEWDRRCGRTYQGSAMSRTTVPTATPHSSASRLMNRRSRPKRHNTDMATNRDSGAADPCLDYRRLSVLSAAEVAPAHREDVPDVLWARSDLSGLWDWASGPGRQALGAALDRLLSDRAGEPAITDALLDGLPTGARLHGLDFRMKSPVSTAGKIPRKREGSEPDRVTVAKFTDTLRYTVCTERHDDIVPAARRVLDELVARGLSVVEASSRYRDGVPYKGLLFLIRDGAGNAFELQVHSELSQGIKDETHGDYEIARDPVTFGATDTDVDAALARCFAASRRVSTPVGLDDVVEFGGCELMRL